jgi:hypothetical protein
MKEILLNSLPQYIDWIKLALAEQGLSVKHKTEKEVTGEFQDEKWGRVLEDVKELSNPSLEEVDNSLTSSSTRPHFSS